MGTLMFRCVRARSKEVIDKYGVAYLHLTTANQLLHVWSHPLRVLEFILDWVSFSFTDFASHSHTVQVCGRYASTNSVWNRDRATYE